MSKLLKFDKEQLQRFKKIIVFGDLHGDYAALKSGLSTVDPAKDSIIFLGDYADRGPSGIEVIDAVDSLAINYPNNVFALKGNHEDYAESGKPTFRPCTLVNEVEEKRGDWQDYFHSTLKMFIDRLWLAAVVPGEILFVHGGISSKIRSFEDLEDPTRDIETDVLWSDPFEGCGERPNWERGGVGVEFGKDVSDAVCQSLGVKRIVRSHQPSEAVMGPCYSHDDRVVTISSTSVYGGEPFLLSFDRLNISQFRVVNLLEPTPGLI